MSRVGVVVIGRNEGARIARALASVGIAPAVIYVDANSSDGSSAHARTAGVPVVELRGESTFTAAAARNAGAAHLRQEHPPLDYIQFLDGDCTLESGWLDAAAAHLDSRPSCAAVAGALTEAAHERHIYSRIFSMQRNLTGREAEASGGNMFVRCSAFYAADGFRSELVAGEDSELWRRLRRASWSIERIAVPMCSHDGGIDGLSAWFVRLLRHGYGAAQLAHRGSAGGIEPAVLRNLAAVFFAIVLPAALFGLTAAFGAWALAGAVLYVFPATRLFAAARRRGYRRHDAATYSFWQLCAFLPLALGSGLYSLRRSFGGKDFIFTPKKYSPRSERPLPETGL